MVAERARELANRIALRVAPGRVNRWFWAHRAPEDPASYLQDDLPRDPHRLELIQRLTAFDAASYLELGSGVGPNLALLLERRPDAEIIGVEISPAAAAAGDRFFTDHGRSNVSIRQGRFEDALIERDQYDVVFACISLCIATPNEAGAIIRAACVTARKGLVLVEPRSIDGTTDVAGKNLWAHDYAQLVRSAVPDATVLFEEVADAGGMPTGAWVVQLPAVVAPVATDGRATDARGVS